MARAACGEHPTWRNSATTGGAHGRTSRHPEGLPRQGDTVPPTRVNRRGGTHPPALDSLVLKPWPKTSSKPRWWWSYRSAAAHRLIRVCTCCTYMLYVARGNRVRQAVCVEQGPCSKPRWRRPGHTSRWLPGRERQAARLVRQAAWRKGRHFAGACAAGTPDAKPPARDEHRTGGHARDQQSPGS